MDVKYRRLGSNVESLREQHLHLERIGASKAEKRKFGRTVSAERARLREIRDELGAERTRLVDLQRQLPKPPDTNQ